MHGNFDSLAALAERVEQVDSAKHDLVATTNAVRVIDDDRLAIGEHEVDVLPHAHGQIAERLKIPRPYYNRVGGEFPGLRTEMLRRHFQDQPERRLFRTMTELPGEDALDGLHGGALRAFLSDRYRPMDNAWMLSALLPAMEEVQAHHPISIESQAMTATRFYLQITFPGVEAQVQQGDVIRAGVQIVNSEVGSGALDIRALVWRLVCVNGMVGQSMVRQHHVGRRVGEDDSDYSVFRDDTIAADLEALRLRARDLLIDAASEVGIATRANEFRAAIDDQAEVKVPELVENVTKRFTLRDSESEALTETLYQDEQGRTRYGLVNGLTALAHRVQDPDRQYAMERLGQSVLDMPSKEWAALSAN